MIVLLQWTWSQSPWRNQTPGATRLMVSGLASERETNSAKAANPINPISNQARRFFMGASPFRSTLHLFRSQGNSGIHRGSAPRRQVTGGQGSRRQQPGAPQQSQRIARVDPIEQRREESPQP